MACLAVSAMTLYALVLNNVTVVPRLNRSTVIQAVAVCAAAMVITGFIWSRVAVAGRVVLAPCVVANLWTLLDAGGRRLPGVMGW